MLVPATLAQELPPIKIGTRPQGVTGVAIDNKRGAQRRVVHLLGEYIKLRMPGGLQKALQAALCMMRTAASCISAGGLES